MTIEEAIDILSYIKTKLDDSASYAEHDVALDMAIKALEQQPCEDCISREAVEEMIKAEMPERGMWEIGGDTVKNTVCEVCVDLMQELSKLPSITPQLKIGKWITQWDVAQQQEYYCCSECREEFSYDAETGIKMNDYKYCPNCGAKMEVEE